jgi:hypothetical protein
MPCAARGEADAKRSKFDDVNTRKGNFTVLDVGQIEQGSAKTTALHPPL